MPLKIRGNVSIQCTGSERMVVVEKGTVRRDSTVLPS